MKAQARKGLLIESRAVQLRGPMRLARWLLATAAVAFVLAPAQAQAQVQVTPNFSITPSSSVTKWIMWMALGAIILAVLVLAAVGVSYLRFAPKFFGREEPPKRLPPGARPLLLNRAAPQQAAVGATRPAAQMAAGSTATAVAERPAARPAAAEAPAAATSEAPAAEAPAPEAPAPEAPADAPAAAAQPTAAPAGEPAVQADAVGEAEAAAPEARPTAKSAEEVGAQPEETVAKAPTTAQTAEAAPEAAAPEAAAPEAAAPEAAAPEAPAPSPAQPAARGGAAALDQETFDRVLEEQLGKGVDRRVAEGRARAAAVVAARKKAQG